MWGGGVLCLGAIGFNLANHQPPFGDLFVVDDPAGWWFPNWGRNFVLPTESVYHVLVAGTWLGVLQRRWVLAFCGAAALAATHPFSGAQHLAILGGWVGFLALRDRTMVAFVRASAVGFMLLLFAGYYFWFLTLFPEYRQLQANWGHVWKVSLPFLALSSGPVVGLAVWRLRSRQWRLGDKERFLLVAGGITLLLMKHDWFIPARQPLHFSRGYNWLPFWLIALPQLQEWGLRVGARSRALAVASVALASGILIFDNVAFVVREWQEGERSNHHLDFEQRDIFAWMDGAKLTGVMLCADPRMSYLSATYTGVRPYFGHLANTPDVHRRWREVSAWQRRGESGAWFNLIDYILIERRNPPVGFNREHWRELYGNSGYVLLGRAP
jgi:hypothetical protein